jgi:hypothetical protein
MFKDWAEYRDFLVTKLVRPEQQDLFNDKFRSMDKKYRNIADITVLHRAHVQTILTNDFHFTKLNNFERNPELNTFRKYDRGEQINTSLKNKFIKQEEQ